jgi:hypothetical protein
MNNFTCAQVFLYLALAYCLYLYRVLKYFYNHNSVVCLTTGP